MKVKQWRLPDEGDVRDVRYLLRKAEGSKWSMLYVVANKALEFQFPKPVMA